MPRLFTLLLAISSLTAVGQVVYPYNPDGNADTLIGVSDLQDLLVIYGNPFIPSEILVNGEELTNLLSEIQNNIDSLWASAGTSSPTTSGVVFNQSWGFPQGTIGEPNIICLSSGEEYTVPDGHNFYVQLAKDFGCSNDGIQDLYGGWVDNWQIHTTVPSGFNNLGFGPGATLTHFGCGHYVLYGFLCPEVDWLSHETFVLAPGETRIIPEQTQFWAGRLVGNTSSLSFDVAPECGSYQWWEINQPYASGGSHLWSGAVTNNSDDETIVAYGYSLTTDHFISTDATLVDAYQEVEHIVFSADNEAIAVSPSPTIVLSTEQCGNSNTAAGVNCHNLSLTLDSGFYEGGFSDFEEVRIFNAGTLLSDNPIFYDQEVRFSIYGQEYGVLPNRFIVLVYFQGEWFVKDDGLIGDD